MTKISGRFATAIAYASIIDDTAREQIALMCDQPFAEDANIRIMPDVHAGKGCTIGTTMRVTDKIVPNIVGVDIGCGMYTINLGNEPIDMMHLDEACHSIPCGFDVWPGRREAFDLEQLRAYRQLNKTKHIQRSIGTLGGGNHFIEVDRASDGTYYLIIHSGSRNLGTQIAAYYQQLAIELHQGKEEYFIRKDALIAEYKAAGRRKEIQNALKELHWEEREPDAPKDLCWLYGSYMEDYLHDIEVCQRFAKRNREVMAEVILESIGRQGTDAFHTIHNYIDVDEMVLRKGAIAAHKGEMVLIPINMRDGSILARGKGNPDWNESAPHGAGRLMSRNEAHEKLDLEEFKKQMEGIYTTCVGESTLDEAPMAYKSIDDIIGHLGDTVEVIDVLKPVYNFKAS
ncbi:MAG: RtcB family protein [Coriobacteriaceae bacterium]|nr:RtcB family protein [Coriobacteriaceae bacterium]